MKLLSIPNPILTAAAMALLATPVIAADVGVSIAVDYPVCFVQERWYNDVYVPAYRERQGKGHDKKPPKGKGSRHD
jgi:hypothetical protein